MAPIALVLALVAAAGAGATPAASPGPAAGPKALLPDLAAAAPSGLVVRDVGRGEGRRFLLSIVSAAENLGVGPVVVRAHRPSAAVPTMIADQVVRRADGSTVTYRRVGEARFVEDATHRHWHLLRAMSYELRRTGDRSLVRPDEKTGFCLGDRYDARGDLPNEPPEPVFMRECGLDRPDLLSLVEGISVGYGDDYQAWRDGQSIDVTGLPPGRYELAHRVNPDRGLHEERYGNNASSLLLALTWPNGLGVRPTVRALKVCPRSARCAPGSG